MKKILCLLLTVLMIVPMAVASADETVTIRFSWWGNDSRHEKTLAAIKLYEESHTNVKIEAEYRGKSEHDKVATELASGTAPDLVQLNPPWMGDFTANGDFFVDLRSYADVIDLAGFDQQLIADYGMDGEDVIALPSGVNARTWIVNKTQLDKLGIKADMDTAWTWESLIEIGKQVNAANPEMYFLNADKVDLTEFVLRPYIIQKTGKQLIGDDYQIGFERQDLVDALTYISRLFSENVVLPAAEGNVFLNSVWTNPDWINGKLMTELSWTSLIAGATGDMVDEAWITTLPLHEGAANTSIVVKPSQLFAITKTSEHPEVAADFLNFFLTNTEAGVVLGDARGIPPYKAVQDACAEAGVLAESVVVATQFAQANSGLYENDLSTNAEITLILNDAVEAISYDASKIDSVVDNSMALIEDVLFSLQ